MIEKVREFIAKYHMLEKNDNVVAGVSGGADSVCLLFLLAELQQEYVLTIQVVHVNHKIRTEAGEDAAYVQKLCERLGFPCFLFEEDVEVLAAKEHLSSEEAGRKVRYDAFQKVFEEQHANKIAVAHNRNDRAETVLFNLFRGSSVKGMTGIAPVREHIIRPLLCVERSEIEAYLQERQIPYCTDCTNAEDTYTRNRIRNRILPYVEEKICENVVSHISDTAEILEETEQFLRKMTLMSYEKLVQEEADILKIDRNGFLELDTIIQKYLIMECMHRLAGSRKDITSKHVQAVLDLFAMPVNKKVNLPYHMMAGTDYESIGIWKLSAEEKETERQEEAYVLKPNQSVTIPGLGEVKTEIFPYEKTQGIPEKAYTKWFDYDKIGESMVLRHRKSGDYLTINEQNNTKSLKTYMIHEKIPQEIRDRLYVLAVENHIVWLIGYRISQQYKVDQNTKRILAVHIVGGNK